MRIFSRTDKGVVRNSNQDSELHGFFDGEDCWAVVCDGMGGANGGGVASSLAVGEISRCLELNYSAGMSDQDILNLLGNAIIGANVRVYEKAQENLYLRGMGTTVVAVIVNGGRAHIAYAGDSRAYVLSAEADGGIKQLTVDHSLVQSFVDRGMITAEEAHQHPLRNVITRALGVNDTLDVDYCVRPLDRGDVLLICSDGLSNCVEENEICGILRADDGQAAVDKLVDSANRNGGTDNITAVVIYID